MSLGNSEWVSHLKTKQNESVTMLIKLLLHAIPQLVNILCECTDSKANTMLVIVVVVTRSKTVSEHLSHEAVGSEKYKIQ